MIELECKLDVLEKQLNALNFKSKKQRSKEENKQPLIRNFTQNTKSENKQPLQEEVAVQE